MEFLLGIILTIGFIHQVPAQSTCPPCSYDQICENSTCECDMSLYPDFADLNLPSVLQKTQLICNSQQLILRLSGCLGRLLPDYNFTDPVSTPETFPCFYYYGPNKDVTGEALVAFNFSSISPSCIYDFSANGSYATHSIRVLFEYMSTGQLVILHNNVAVNFSCSYPLDMIASLNLAIKPIQSSTNITVTGVGTYQSKMALYKNSDFTDPYTESDKPISLRVEDPLYIGAFVIGADPNKFSYKTVSCYATPENDSNSLVKYPIISDGCPIPTSAYVKIVENGDALTSKFWFKAFKFAQDDALYLFCNGTLCSGTCIPTCTGRSADTGESLIAYPPIGPIHVHGDSSSASTVNWKAWLLLPLLALKML
ncbi:uromodulin-like [Protopterus annectens]|uniref:uromodulin-like n=1 Tax=Protopterus annectens TaxID=7888 RepID=UPI001CF97CEB|nr:uromodulin-like [Protopterus annectens]